MSDFAILVGSEADVPRVVRLQSDSRALELIGVNSAERIPWWLLYRVDDRSATHTFRRLGRSNWELRVTAGNDKELLSHVGPRPLVRLMRPLRRIQGFKIILGLAVLGVTVVQHFPATWAAAMLPNWALARLTATVVSSHAAFRCSQPGGEDALRRLLVQLDPEIAPKVTVIANRDGGFTVASAPAQHIFIYHSALNEIDADALPALLGHELSHIRHGDPTVALVRERGLLGTWAMVLENSERAGMQMRYSGAEERRADVEAMVMMRRAGMPLKPAADLFEQTRIATAQGGYFMYRQRDFHFGIDSRAARWAAAARSDAPEARSRISETDKDALFNFCWTGPIPALPNGARRAGGLRNPGSGTIGRSPR